MKNNFKFNNDIISLNNNQLMHYCRKLNNSPTNIEIRDLLLIFNPQLDLNLDYTITNVEICLNKNISDNQPYLQIIPHTHPHKVKLNIVEPSQLVAYIEYLIHNPAKLHKVQINSKIKSTEEKLLLQTVKALIERRNSVETENYYQINDTIKGMILARLIAKISNTNSQVKVLNICYSYTWFIDLGPAVVGHIVGKIKDNLPRKNNKELIDEIKMQLKDNQLYKNNFSLNEILLVGPRNQHKDYNKETKNMHDNFFAVGRN